MNSSTTNDVLSRTSLFVEMPGEVLETEVSIETVENAGVEDILGLKEMSYQLLQDERFSFGEKLKVWESRLVLHLFDGNLVVARREAVNLNNLLNLNEYGVAPSVGGAGAAGAAPAAPAGSKGDTTGGKVWPLPKNNNGVIDHSLLILILRLKSTPNLVLVNELYKLCYQLRLKSSGNSNDQLRVKLENLSYDIALNLMILKNDYTLVNFLQSIRHELLVLQGQHSLDEGYSNYLSNVTLLWIIVYAVVIFKLRESAIEQAQEVLVQKFKLIYDRDVSPTTIGCLHYVLSRCDPDVTPPSSFDDLVTFLASCNNILQIVTLLSGTWDIMNVFGFELSLDHKHLQQPATTEHDTQDIVTAFYRKVTLLWGKHIDKVHGLG